MVHIEMITNNTENNDINQLPPPPSYATIIYKLNENDFDRNSPPAYSDVDVQSITYINNYPGPPLTDGVAQITQDVITNNSETRKSKNVRIYLIINGIILLLLGTAIAGIEIGIIVSNAIIYYYYGFWGGGIIICLGISSILYYKPHHIINCTKLFYSFFSQTILIAIVFAIGIGIIVTDKCDDISSDDSANETCKHAYKIFNGFLFGLFGSTFALLIINTIIFGLLKR